MASPSSPAEMTIDSLDLQFTPSGEERFTVRVLDSPAGSGGRHEFALPFSAEELAAARGLVRVDAGFARQFGLRLYEAACGGDVRQLLLATLHGLQARPRSDGARLLQVRLGLSETPALANLPWEYLYVQELGLHLALMQQVSLLRHLNVRRRSNLASVAPPLQVLCVIAAPQDLAAVDAAGEWLRLTKSFAPLRAAGMVQIERLAKPTFGALAKRLRAEPVHILHFIGHGVFDGRAGTGALVLEDGKQQALPVSADQLAQVLGNQAALQLVVLNACMGAQSATDDASAGVAQRLVLGGTPAVAAMQFAVTDAAAAIFSSEFYGALGHGLSVDEAMQGARQAIYAQPNVVEWATPVLFAAKGEPLRILAADASQGEVLAPMVTAVPGSVTTQPSDAAGEPGNRAGSTGRWGLLATGLLVVVGLLAVWWLVGGRGSVTPAGELPAGVSTGTAGGSVVGFATSVPQATAGVTAVTTATAASMPAALPAARRPITVGLAALVGCVQPDVEDGLRAALTRELAKTSLLDRRVLLEELAGTLVDEAGARRYGDAFDIVVWGGCAPASEGMGETLTVTATVPLVGDSWEEAVAHRVAQPPEVALSVGGEQAGLAGEALAAVLAYYGEDEIEYAAQLLDRVASKLDAEQVGTVEQRVRFHWLAGNAWMEHPEYILGVFPKNRSVDEHYRNSARLRYQAAITLTEALSPLVDVGPQLSALHQNLGWMHYKAGSPTDVTAYRDAAAEFEAAAEYGENTVGILEGIAHSSRALREDAETIIGLCEPMRAKDANVRFRVCRGYAELSDNAGSLGRIAELAKAAQEAAPSYAPSEYLIAIVECELEHNTEQALTHLKKYQSAARVMPRWDAFGWEIESDRAASMLEYLQAAPDTACAGN